MESLDLQLIEKHKKDNYELNKLYSEHIEFDKQITELENKVLSGEEQKHLNALKHKKLIGRQEIEKILNQLR